jgi:hypothetical protein
MLSNIKYIIHVKFNIYFYICRDVRSILGNHMMGLTTTHRHSTYDVLVVDISYPQTTHTLQPATGATQDRHHRVTGSQHV